jgi:hypothetical protein
MNRLLDLYTVIVVSTLFVTALCATNGDQPKEIKGFYSWVFYGVLFPLIWIKELIKFLINLFKR